MSFITAEVKHFCTICDGLTDQVESNFQTHVHPGECTDALYEEYSEALHQIYHESNPEVEYCISCDRGPDVS